MQPKIEVQQLPNGWYACRCSHPTLEFFKADILFASVLEAFLALYPYAKTFDINWPSGVKEDKLEKEAKQYFQLQEE